MTIVVDAPEVEQVKKQLHKLINVVKISEFDPVPRSSGRSCSCGSPAAPGKRGEILEIASIFDAIAVDVGRQLDQFPDRRRSP